MARLQTTLCALTLVAGTAAPVWADDPKDDADQGVNLQERNQALSFATLDRASNESFVSLSASTTAFDEDGPDIAWRDELYAQGVSSGGFGGYLVLPLLRYDNGVDSAWYAGNLELGGIMTGSLSDNIDTVGRVGLVLPTASEDLLSLEANAATSFVRLTDSSSNIPDQAVLRAAVSTSYHRGNFLARVDTGIDMAVEWPDNTGLEDMRSVLAAPGVNFARGMESGDSGALVRLNLGAGYVLGPVGVSAELATVGSLRKPTYGKSFYETFALAGTVGIGMQAEGFVASVWPLNSDKASVTPTFSALAGLRVPISF